jgi:hypothetical protein
MNPSAARSLLFVLIVCVASLAPAAAEAADVQVTVTRIKALGDLRTDAEPKIDPALRKFASKLKDLRYARYIRDDVARKDLSWGQSLTNGSGATKISVTPTAPKKGESIPLAVRIGSGKSCLKTQVKARSGASFPVFCDGKLEGGTIVYFVSVERL